MKFLQKHIDKFKECQANESTKKIHLRRKKGKHGTGGTNSNASYCNSEAAARGVRLKKVFLEISQNSQENTCARGGGNFLLVTSCYSRVIS